MRLRWSAICPGGKSLHLASVKALPSDNAGLHRHDFFECFFVDRGHGTHSTDAGELPLKADVLCFVRPDQRHAVRGRGAVRLEFTNCAFTAESFQAALSTAPQLGTFWREGATPRSVALTAAQRSAFHSL
ncbi:MAG: AraC family ligand binding domain-containing protein, partial [Planctomycetota bacterium]